MKEYLRRLFKQVILNFQKIPVLALLPSMLFMILASVIGITIYRTQSVADREIMATLSSVKFIEDTPLGPQEINFTDKTINIFSESVKNNEAIFSTSSRLISEIEIEEIVFPPIRNERLKIVDNPRRGFVENYFNTIYNLLSNLNTSEDITQITIRAIDGKTNQINYEVAKTEDIYRQMYRVEVPSKALALHKNYLQIIQTQYNLYTNIANIQDDPNRLQIDLIVTQEILARLRERVNERIAELSQEYNLEIQNNNE